MMLSTAMVIMRMMMTTAMVIMTMMTMTTLPPGSTLTWPQSPGGLWPSLPRPCNGVSILHLIWTHEAISKKSKGRYGISHGLFTHLLTVETHEECQDSSDCQDSCRQVQTVKTTLYSCRPSQC